MSSTLNLLQYNHNIVTTETEETLSNGLDTDLSNISETGKEYITTIGYPSSTYTSLTVGSSGASYTAPADGWVNFGKNAGGYGRALLYASIFGLRDIGNRTRDREFSICGYGRIGARLFKNFSKFKINNHHKPEY